MGFGGRAYLSNTRMFNKDEFFAPNLIGGSIEYDVDLSQVGCNCNAALYMIAMPANNSDGSSRPGEDGMFYCDANKVGGAFCPEFDIMEANQFAWKSINHYCSIPDDQGYYDWCDKIGRSGVDIITDYPDSDPYGPGPEYTINTLEEFHVRAEFFEGVDGKLQSYTITLSQEGRDVGMRSDGRSLSKISDDFENGMTFAMSIWTDYGHPWGNFDWLHHNVCDKHEPCGLPDLKLRNLAIRTKLYRNTEIRQWK